MFGLVDFREDEEREKKKKNERENFLKGIWLGRGEKKGWWNPSFFYQAYQKILFPKWGKNWFLKML